MKRPGGGKVAVLLFFALLLAAGSLMASCGAPTVTPTPTPMVGPTPTPPVMGHVVADFGDNCLTCHESGTQQVPLSHVGNAYTNATCTTCHQEPSE